MQEVSFHAMLRMSRVSFLCTNAIEVYGGCKSCKYMMTQGKKKSQGGHNDRRAKLVWYLLDVYFTPCSEFAQLKHFQTRVGGVVFIFFEGWVY